MADAATFDVTNKASSTAGDQRFDKEYSPTYVMQVMHAEVNTVTLAVRDTDDIASTSGSTVELNVHFVGGITGDDLMDQDYNMHSRVFEGIADYVRLKAGNVPGHWVNEGGGDRWDQGPV
uniref:Uncharacterized protein n=1 Tax=Aegilops tauschii TaxID=37682 RepID=N1R0Z7_AEGTA